MASWNDTYNAGLGHDDHHYGAADHTDGTPDTGVERLHELAPVETRNAQKGQLEATHGYQTPGPFAPSNGLHSVGADHVGCFADAVNRSGGVRQGPFYTSNPASGVARAGVVNAHADDWIDVQSQGTGDTFENRQHRRWAGRGG